MGDTVEFQPIGEISHKKKHAIGTCKIETDGKTFRYVKVIVHPGIDIGEYAPQELSCYFWIQEDSAILNTANWV